MPRTVEPVAWSGPRDAQVRRMRQEGAIWAEIAAAVGVSVDAARERGRRIGAARPPAAAPAAATREDPSRPPLPPGHPRAWALLTEGTLLAGQAWPGWA